jgi:hypothetical protein
MLDCQVGWIQHPAAGMLLVDTSPAAEFLIEVNQPGYDEGDGMEMRSRESP